jgi:hypothetical protein
MFLAFIKKFLYIWIEKRSNKEAKVMNPEERRLLRLRIIEDCVGLFFNTAVFYFLILLAISLPLELSAPSSLTDSLYLLKLRMTRLFFIGVASALLGIYGFLLSYNQIKSIGMLKVADEKFRRIYSIWSPIVGIFLLLLSIEIFRLPFILLNSAEKALGTPLNFQLLLSPLLGLAAFCLGCIAYGANLWSIFRKVKRLGYSPYEFYLYRIVLLRSAKSA